MEKLSGPDGRELTRRYRDLRRRVGRLVGSNYDLTNRCNLRCEGCLFFAGEDSSKDRSAGSDDDWERFFAAEAARGVNWGYFAGAEPALVLGRLRSARRHIAKGVVFTNGTIRIPGDIRYRLHVSVWGDEEHSERLRGANVLAKAIKNYADDDRAIFVYTISAQNLDRIVPTVALLARHRAIVTFNYYSPTTTYLEKLRSAARHDEEYFRFSSRRDNLVLGPDHFAAARRAVATAQAAFPGTTRYSLDYDRWITRPGGLYDIDAVTGVARDCGNRLTAHFRHYNADMSINEGKCCSPNIDCGSCRAYAQSYATFLTRHREFARDAQSFRTWLEVWDLWTDLFMGPEQAGTPARVASAPHRLAEASAP